MPRWDPDARKRLVDSATELFELHGYDETTIAQIAERAGLTRRSFFRHFPDKREVLFADSERHTALITDMVFAQGTEVPACDAVMSTLSRVGEHLLKDPAAQSLRQNLIDGSAELQERERTKLATIAAALAAGLTRRGIPAQDAQSFGAVAAEIFHSAYSGAIRDPGALAFADRLEETRATITEFLRNGVR
nr:TetR/AcrR family transcriptional regulator [Rhodococcus sp. (in: high G+C Gram-positive bacteria)]